MELPYTATGWHTSGSWGCWHTSGASYLGRPQEVRLTCAATQRFQGPGSPAPLSLPFLSYHSLYAGTGGVPAARRSWGTRRRSAFPTLPHRGSMGPVFFFLSFFSSFPSFPLPLSLCIPSLVLCWYTYGAAGAPLVPAWLGLPQEVLHSYAATQRFQEPGSPLFFLLSSLPLYPVTGGHTSGAA